MQSKNPVFARSEEFNGRAAQTTYSDPSQWQVDLSGGGSPTHTERGTGRMTIDTVVEKTAITLGVLIAAAAVAWLVIGETLSPDREVQDTAVQTAYTLTLVGGLGGFVLSMVNSFKKVVSPALVIAYAALEGLFVGAFSKVVVSFMANGDVSIVFGAVLGTLAAFGGTLAAYKFFDIQVGDRFRKIVVASMFGFVAVSLLDFVLHLFGSSFGFNGFGTMGLISSFIGVVIAVFMLILDFDYVERGVAAGIPERESWRAAFGLTVTLVWLYIEILRILAIFYNND
ncbi:Bax inhibitor-1/YccA family protein [Aeromicrobium terrae]|uniref:Bax inhibitor-1/YccA family protein n=1 Tax=Aeromicrobium terrae TaxID=2498846 RepID=A0A5C8NJT6_9ACTN|nr:Bax inhibitor-1/YccA family protein [Aeromicrobium terrae]TXL61538.1 Bax inhibitor-1/YccA family protein [Aeromicrobium terrae]